MAVARTGGAHDVPVPLLVRQEPPETRGEVRQPGQRGLAQRGRRGERQQADHRPHPQRQPPAVVGGQHVVEEPVLLVPQTLVPHGFRDVREVFEELGRGVLVGRVLLGEDERHLQQVQRVHRHPGGAVALLQPARRNGGAVQRPDVVQPQEAALEDVVAVGVLAVDPPGEVEQQLVEDAGEEAAVALAARPGDPVDAPGRPGVHRRIDVAESPFVGGDLAVGVHVPLAQHQHQLPLGELRVDVRDGDAVERQVPGGVPRILPRVGHRDDVVVVEVPPVAVASGGALRGRWRAGRVAVQPAVHVVVEELLAPHEPGDRLPQHHRLLG